MIKRNRQDPLFSPGSVYVIYGEPDSGTSWADQFHHAYKIGATGFLPEHRIYKASFEDWPCKSNLRVVHTIHVDNMRVVEAMLHEKYRARKVTREWFLIDDNLDEIRQYTSICVSGAIRRLSSGRSAYYWWHQYSPSFYSQKIAVLWSKAVVC